jgi:hypothetical protein
MGIRRTKKEKLSAKHQFNFNQAISYTHVKGQINLGTTKAKPKPVVTKNADYMDKDNDTAQVKSRIIKSLLLVSLILATEVVIYLGRFVGGR